MSHPLHPPLLYCNIQGYFLRAQRTMRSIMFVRLRRKNLHTHTNA